MGDSLMDRTLVVLLVSSAYEGKSSDMEDI